MFMLPAGGGALLVEATAVGCIKVGTLNWCKTREASGMSMLPAGGGALLVEPTAVGCVKAGTITIYISKGCKAHRQGIAAPCIFPQ
jgi:hypothetical protein